MKYSHTIAVVFVVSILSAPYASGQNVADIISAPNQEIDFGRRVAAADSTLLISAPDDSTGENARGSVFVYRLAEGGWEFQTKLVRPDSSTGTTQFANDVSIATVDGAPVAVVSLTSGSMSSLLVYAEQDGAWVQTQEISGPLVRADFDSFSDELVVGNGTDLDVYRHNGQGYSLVTTLTSDDHWLGSEIKSNGRVIVSSEWSFDPVPAGAASFLIEGGSDYPYLEIPLPDSIGVNAETSLSDSVLAIVTDEGANELVILSLEGGLWVVDEALNVPVIGPIALAGNRLFLSHPTDSTFGDGAGSVLMYERTDEGWVLANRMASPSPGANQAFGRVHEDTNGNRLFVSDGNGEVYQYAVAELVSREKTFPALQLSLAVYPNPATNLLRVSGLSKDAASIRLFNILGQQVDIVVLGEEEIAELDISRLAPGAYILRVDSKVQTNASRVVTIAR